MYGVVCILKFKCVENKVRECEEGVNRWPGKDFYPHNIFVVLCCASSFPQVMRGSMRGCVRAPVRVWDYASSLPLSSRKSG